MDYLNYDNLNLDTLRQYDISIGDMVNILVDGGSLGDILTLITKKVIAYHNESENDESIEKESDNEESVDEAIDENLENENENLDEIEDDNISNDDDLNIRTEPTEQIFAKDDFSGTAKEFEEHFNLKSGFYTYYQKLREKKDFTDENLFNLFNQVEIFDVKTTIYDIWNYFNINDIKDLLDSVYPNYSNLCELLLDFTTIDSMRKMVQIGIEKEDDAPEFYIALTLFFIHGKKQNLFQVINEYGVDFETNENVWEFFGNKKIYHYFNLVETKLEMNMLWSNMNKVLEIRNHFKRLIRNIVENT